MGPLVCLGLRTTLGWQAQPGATTRASLAAALPVCRCQPPPPWPPGILWKAPTSSGRPASCALSKRVRRSDGKAPRAATAPSVLYLVFPRSWWVPHWCTVGTLDVSLLLGFGFGKITAAADPVGFLKSMWRKAGGHRSLQRDKASVLLPLFFFRP